MKGNLNDVGKNVSSFRKDLDALQPTFQKMAAVGTAAFAGVVAIAGTSLQAYAEVERAQRQLEHAIIDVSKGTKDQVDQVTTLTAALQKKAGIDADSLNMGVAQLSTFGLQTESVIGLTKSLADLTVNQSGLNAGSEDYITSANNIAKALHGQFGILEKMGIRFTETQQNLILYGTEAEKVSALQEGFAQNLRETTDTVAGTDLAMAKLRRTMEDIQEGIGKALAPAFADLAQRLQPVLDTISQWVEANPTLTGNIILLAGAVAGVVAVMGALALAFLAINPVTIIIVGAIAGVSLIIYGLYNAVKMLGPVWDSVWSGIKSVTGSVVDYVIAKVDLVIKKAKDAMNALMELPGAKIAVSATKKAFTAVSDIFRASGGPVASNTPYIVGEVGPELFVPNSAGSIVPNHALQPAMGGGGSPVYLTFNIGQVIGQKQYALEMGDYIIDEVKKNLRL